VKTVRQLDTKHPLHLLFAIYHRLSCFQAMHGKVSWFAKQVWSNHLLFTRGWTGDTSYRRGFNATESLASHQTWPKPALHHAKTGP